MHRHYQQPHLPLMHAHAAALSPPKYLAVSVAMPPIHRPQTLKQAKKAYRKSGATVRLSESELAIIERRGVLQERADRIKEREARRKANIKRKEERNQREREARARMGIEEPVKEGIAHVGPSQLSLGGFLGNGTKRKRDEAGDKENDGRTATTGATRAERDFWRDQEGKICHPPSIIKTPWRNPLKVIPANSTARKTPPESSFATDNPSATKSDPNTTSPPSPNNNLLEAKAPNVRVQTATPPEIAKRAGAPTSNAASAKSPHFQATAMVPPPLRAPIQNLPPNSMPQPKPPHRIKDSQALVKEEPRMERCHSTLMAPRPSRIVLLSRLGDSNIQQRSPITALQEKPPDTFDECWEEFFVSGTQIARELSPPTRKTISDVPPTEYTVPYPSNAPPIATKNQIACPNIRTMPKLPPPPRPPSQVHTDRLTAPKDDTTDLLNLISTQDLDFSGDLTQAAPHVPHENADTLLAQISTQDLDFSLELTQAAPKARSFSSEFDEDLTEEDLEDVALEIEREATAKSRTTTPQPQRTSSEVKSEDVEPARAEHSSQTTNSKTSSDYEYEKAMRELERYQDWAVENELDHIDYNVDC